MKTPAKAGTEAGAHEAIVVERRNDYSTGRTPARPSLTWTLDANLFVIAFAVADRVTA